MMAVSIRCMGHVQGVFFRKYTRDKARELGLAGWVKNESNGDVLILAIGGEEQLQNLVAWCHTGSPQSTVTDVKWEQVELPLKHPFSSFEIRY